MKTPWKHIAILSAAAIFSMGLFIFMSSQTYRIGYPLDDAWIHQTFARNLIRYRQLAYFPGVPAAGSTAPLWTFLLSIGYLFSNNNFLWTMTLGLVSLFTLGWLGEEIFRKIQPEYAARFPWVGMVLILEWHFVWAAASGMETLLLADISLAILLLLLMDREKWLWMGALIGLGVWIRPDALMLFGPVLLVLGIQLWKRTSNWKAFIRLLLGAVIILTPYFLMNYIMAGRLWPNTFYAKQLEYQELLRVSFPLRLWGVFQQHIVGIGILLLPGFFYQVWISIRKRDWTILAFLIWWMGFLGIYAMRLPVSYQHGRYEIPIMPFFLLLGGAGVFSLWQKSRGSRIARVLVTAWMISIFLVGVGFLGLGSRTYANDVAIIESEMVDTATWVRGNTPSDSVIAAHDIGALGFFGERKILDLAGLISPDVIPVIRDETGLQKFILNSHAAYLMTFPGWYPRLTEGLIPVYISRGKFSPLSGGENMNVYKINNR